MITTATDTTDQSAVTVLGLGPMGVALAQALQRHGHTVTVWNRSPHRARSLVDQGARLAESPAQAVSASPLTIVCVKDYPAMYEILTPAEHELRGRTLVNLGSGTPQEVRQASTWLTAQGAQYLDGAIMVPPAMIGDEAAVVFYSGPNAVFDTHRTTLSGIGTATFLGTDSTLSVLYNTAMLGLMYANLVGLLHATALVGTAGVTASDFTDTALSWFVPQVVNGDLADLAASLDKRAYPPDQGTMDMNVKALEHIVDTSEQLGIDAGLPDYLRALGERSIAQGYGDNNFLAVIETLRHGMTPSESAAG